MWPSSIFKRSKSRSDSFDALQEAKNGVNRAISDFVGQSAPHLHEWTGDWDDWDVPVKQTMVQYDDHLEMRLAPFKEFFIINRERQDYNGQGFVGWLADIIEFRGREFYCTYWQWPKGERFPIHYHDWEEQHHVIFGEIDYYVDGQKRTLHQGHSHCFPADCRHGGIAVEDSLMAMTIERLPEYAP